MSIVAWDGKTLAADCQTTNVSMRIKSRKIVRLDSWEVVAWTGEESLGIALLDWYKERTIVGKLLEGKKDKERWARLIVADRNGCRFYEQEPVPV